MDLGELALSRTWESSPGGQDWPVQLPPRATFWGHPNICPIYDLLECAKGLVLQNNSYRTSPTQDGISKRNFTESPVMMACQRHWTTSMIQCNEHFVRGCLDKRMTEEVLGNMEDWGEFIVGCFGLTLGGHAAGVWGRYWSSSNKELCKNI